MMAKSLKLLINVVSGFNGLLESFHYMLTTFLGATCMFVPPWGRFMERCGPGDCSISQYLDKINLSTTDQWRKMLNYLYH